MSATEAPAASADGDAALLEAARRGDRAAFGRLYDRHAPTTYRYALSIVREPIDAEDVVQDVFLTTWTRIADATVVDASALPWLLTTARFTALNLVRSRTRARNRTDDADLSLHPDHRESPEGEVERRLLVAAIEDAVSELSETDQALYYLCIEQGSSYADAASALGASHGAVRNRLSRLRATLRAALRPLDLHPSEGENR
ncbi:RNA polymerase sigma-70 factor (ECF subfamily) [Rathayibacter tanaceti]|uniref:ECF RNA polymerase sigma factor SigL n=3 Tax=Rathayibacter tanaceti TaxID=1671680 RepID=A0A168GAI3_9MICO|nr:ECF RNA polymerase sigma factor SigL [Rathayibacter tanaceti]QHC57127.1 sigma-70 family RNA polymerase sigma factor [Rathayibacter tanaceti]TCO33762.1 RNA polymerase sigma-70 factor (ECF subfamily) [Rathayibacter tanaceti]